MVEKKLHCSILQRIKKLIIYLDLCEDLSFEMVGLTRPLKPLASLEVLGFPTSLEPLASIEVVG